MFNPASAFPKQTTFTPNVHRGGVQQAVNAVDWGLGRPAGGAPMVSTAGKYAGAAAQALAMARGASGAGQGVHALGQRTSPVNEFYQHQMAKAGKRPSARSGYAAQPDEQGIPGRPIQDGVSGMGMNVLDSDNTPLSAGIHPALLAAGNRAADKLDSVMSSRAGRIAARVTPIGATAASVNNLIKSQRFRGAVDLGASTQNPLF